jgi:hypothetical protein
MNDGHSSTARTLEKGAPRGMPSRIRFVASDHLVFDYAACKAVGDRRPTRRRSDIHAQGCLETMQTILTSSDDRRRLIARLLALGPQRI